jgi:hypothetical protein
MYNKEFFQQLFLLYSKCGWLNIYTDELSELLSFCENHAEINLISELIQKIKYLTSRERTTYWDHMADYIINNWALNVDKTQISAIADDYEPDSSQAVVQALKAPLSKKGWRSVLIKNQIGKTVENIIDRPNVVLVDEFIGSGDTILRRVKKLRSNCTEFMRANNVVIELNVKVCVLACMESAKSRLETKNIDVYAELWLKKGITDFYFGVERRKAYRNMLTIEKRLDQTKDSSKIYFPFGYKKTEALYATDEGNAVNCMFPIFWWPYTPYGERKTLFTRKEN